jgi:alpha-beta hydrolase superfamily lysophospholipase
MIFLSIIKRNKIKTSFTFILLFNILFIHFYLPRIFIEPNNIVVQLLNKSPNKLSPEAFSLDYKTMNIYTDDGLKLSAYKIYSEHLKSKGTIIFLHGIRAYKEHFLPMCKVLSKKGFNSIIVDLRGHGESGGKYCTFGYYEKHDIVSLLDAAMLDKRINKNIGVWGQSLGGAIALQTMAIDNRIKFGIIESTFSDLNSVSEEYLTRLIKINEKSISNYLLKRVYEIAELESEKVKPKESVKKIVQPILLVHGTKDNRIDSYHALKNFNNLRSKNKTFIQIKGANHINVWKRGGSAYLNKVFSFIKSNSEQE